MELFKKLPVTVSMGSASRQTESNVIREEEEESESVNLGSGGVVGKQ